MTRVSMTGADGFLGWHTKIALREHESQVVSFKVGEQFDIETARISMSGAAQAIHIAGVNRASETEVRDGNISFAQQFADALTTTEQPPVRVVFANSTQATNGSVYGSAKLEAADILARAAAKVGAEFVDVRLPNIFGEHGKPFYNAVTSTFCHLLANGESPTVDADKELTLLHAQNAADLLIGTVPVSEQSSLEVRSTVSGLLARLVSIADTYRRGEIPNVEDTFSRDLFNTYKSYLVGEGMPICLTRHADPRGSFFEIVRSHGGSGQSSFSTTVPGISRGDHFHRRKLERFTVLSGEAVISMRKLFTDQVLSFAVNGDSPAAIDMPTGWAHNITNTGDTDLYTSFWTNEIFDPNRPDTIPEAV